MDASVTSSATTTESGRRAAVAAAAFALAGPVLGVHALSDPWAAAPRVICYAVLVTNTYFSIRWFGQAVRGRDGTQRAVDAVLALLYVALAGSLGSDVGFAAVGTLLFAVATLKYALLLDRRGAAEVLAAKIRIDCIGTVVCAAAVWLAVVGQGPAASWGLAVVSLVANLYVLWWRPLYRVPPPASHTGARPVL